MRATISESLTPVFGYLFISIDTSIIIYADSYCMSVLGRCDFIVGRVTNK